MRDWSTSISKDEVKVLIYDYGFKNSIKMRINGAVDFIDSKLLNHALCGDGLPEFAWKLPLGMPKYDEELDESGKKILNNSLGAKIWEGYSSFQEWVFKDQHKDLVKEIVVNKEDLKVLSPDFAFILDEID